jgi:hypothetical protein
MSLTDTRTEWIHEGGRVDLLQAGIGVTLIDKSHTSSQKTANNLHD